MTTSVTDAQIALVPGWFNRLDVALFRLLLDETSQQLGGDLAELGVYQGKSAVLVGSSLQPGETFTVVDLFGGDAPDSENERENAEQYEGLTRKCFEDRYRSIHASLPVVISGLSGTITEHASHGTHRLVHIDASHLYGHVVGDIDAARILLKSDGVVILDDYRSDHTPGVAAAVWKAVGEGLHPFLISPQKMYATWGDASRWRSALARWLTTGDARHETQYVAGEEILRVWTDTPRAHRYLPPVVIPTLGRVRARVLSR